MKSRIQLVLLSLILAIVPFTTFSGEANERVSQFIMKAEASLDFGKGDPYTFLQSYLPRFFSETTKLTADIFKSTRYSEADKNQALGTIIEKQNHIIEKIIAKLDAISDQKKCQSTTSAPSKTGPDHCEIAQADGLCADSAIRGAATPTPISSPATPRPSSSSTIGR